MERTTTLYGMAIFVEHLMSAPAARAEITEARFTAGLTLKLQGDASHAQDEEQPSPSACAQCRHKHQKTESVVLLHYVIVGAF